MSIDTTEIGISDVRRLVDVCKKNFQKDYSCMALTSFKRRLSKAVELGKFNTISHLIDELEVNKNYFVKFEKDIIIPQTELFRDAGFWRFFRDNITPNYNLHHNINIWVPRCSTGDELYTLCIVLKEKGLLDKCKIIATDSRESNFKLIQEGKFPITKLEPTENNFKSYNPDALFRNYCDVSTLSFQMQMTLIKNVEFKNYDITQGVAFSEKFHIILFRNSLIYYNQMLHDNTVTLLAKSLEKNGYLIIGHRESIHWCRDAKKFTNDVKNESAYKKMID